MAKQQRRLTKCQYWVATIFVDQFSGLDYVCLQESTLADKTIEAKQVLERFSEACGVKIEHHHCDNGIFASRGFRDEVKQSGQTMSFCGVGAHHHNDVAERRIQDLSDSARVMMAHAAHHNPAIAANLWPHALRHSSYVQNMLPRNGHSKLPKEFFCRAPVRPPTRHQHSCGCPVYV